MQSKFKILCSTILLLLASSGQAQPNETASCFTLQVASFPDEAAAKNFIAKLHRAGEKPGWGTVDLPGRGRWTRVFIGSFKTDIAARLYGEALIERRVIDDYLVKTTVDVKSLSRPRTAISRDLQPQLVSARLTGTTPVSNSAMINSQVRPAVASFGNFKATKLQRALLPASLTTSYSTVLPVAAKVKLALAPPVGTDFVPLPDPTRMAINLIVGTSAQKGGLWLTGDQTEGLNRLRWIVGRENSDMISLDESGRVRLNRKLLLRAASASEASPLEAPLLVANYINSNEGLLLLVQLSQGQYRYCLHIGRQAQTAGGVIEITGSTNLDNNYDSRINPYRQTGEKLDRELPSKEFDSLVAINPIALWYNLRTKSLVPAGVITFHELAEAHAKLALRLDYLECGSQPGAHNTAIIREVRLESQRPYSDMTLTLGSNRVLRSEEEIRRFYSQGGALRGSKR